MSAAADTCQIRKVRAGGGVLHGGQRGVDLERLGKVLGALDFEVVVGDAANKKGTKCQRLLTLCQIRQVRAGGNAPDEGERRVDLERLSDGLDALGSEVVVSDAATCKWV